MKTCKNCIYSKIIIPKNTNCPSEFVCSLSDEDFHNCISNDMWHFSSKVLDQPLEDDAINNDLISRGDLINAKPEFMNEKVVRDTKYRTTKDRIYANAWNACNSCWIDTIDNAPTVSDYLVEIARKNFELGRSIGKAESEIVKNNMRIEPEKPQGEWGKWVISEIRCPYCFNYFDTDCYSKEELNKCPICGADMQKGGKE